MPSLQVRELPDHIYLTLCQEAEAEHRSIAQQAVASLAKGLKLELTPQARRRAVLDAVREESVKYSVSGLPDPAQMIREDRER